MAYTALALRRLGERANGQGEWLWSWLLTEWAAEVGAGPAAPPCLACLQPLPARYPDAFCCQDCADAYAAWARREGALPEPVVPGHARLRRSAPRSAAAGIPALATVPVEGRRQRGGPGLRGQLVVVVGAVVLALVLLALVWAVAHVG